MTGSTGEHCPGATTPPGPADVTADLSRRAISLSQRLVATPLALPLRLPLRFLEVTAWPLRASIRRDVRRSIGPPVREVRQPERHPERAFLRPGGVVRQVHGDLPPMVIGGLSALLLQTMHPLTMAGVAEHSGYADDPVGRLRRTATFVGVTTFGSVDDAKEAIDRVRQVHQKVHGVAPDGRPYSAADPDLVTWVHVAEAWSFLRATDRFGERRLARSEQDAYLAETAPLAHELGAQWVPRTVDEVDAYFHRMRPELYAGRQAFEARDFLLRGVARRPGHRAAYTVIAAAAVSILPGWARSGLRIPCPPLVDAAVVTPVAQAFCAGLRWAVAPQRAPA